MGALPQRTVRQLLSGLLPLIAIAITLLVVLSLRLTETSSPLQTADTEARAVVSAIGLGADGRQIAVDYTAADGTEQSGRLTLADDTDIPLGAELEVVYDPARPAVVYARGDAVTDAVSDLVNGLVVIGLVLIAALVTTLVRLLRRRRLTARPPRQIRAHREKYRRGLADRSWLVLHTAGEPSWVPVYWDPSLERLGEDPQPITVYGDPDKDTLLGFDLYGQPVWPSGRRRGAAPKGLLRDLPPPSGGVSLARQARADIVGVFGAPLIGVLWSYIDGSGTGGFLVATIVAAGVLFWLPSLYGSDPT